VDAKYAAELVDHPSSALGLGQDVGDIAMTLIGCSSVEQLALRLHALFWPGRGRRYYPSEDPTTTLAANEPRRERGTTRAYRPRT